MLPARQFRTLSFRIDKILQQDQLIRLWTLSNEHCRLYNHLLEQTWDRIKSGSKVDFKQINEDYKTYRIDNHLTIPSKSAQNTSRGLIANTKSYYALRKTDGNTRFPKRFKSTRTFQSFYYDWNSGNGGFKILKNRLCILKPEISIIIPEYIVEQADFDAIKTVRFHAGPQTDSIYCSLTIGVKTDVYSSDPTRFLSIDPGIKSLITAVTCDGEWFNVRNFDFRGEDRVNDRLRSKRDKAKKYSKRYKRLSATLKRQLNKTANRRKDYHHTVTKTVTDFCINKNIGLIIHGDINTKTLPDANFANRRLNRATQNRGSLSRIKQFLAYKAESKGIAHKLQNEAYTSKTNCFTGEIMQITLSTREIKLTENLTIDRDVNGAINIATKYFRQYSGNWSPQLSWLTALRCVKVQQGIHMSKFE